MLADDVLQLIRSRKSTRAPFDRSLPVTDEELKRILEAGRWTPTAHNIQNYEIVAVRDPDLLGRIGRIKYVVPPEFLEENLKSVSSSEAEWEQKKTGVLATQVPPEFLVAGRELSEDEQAALNARFEKLITATSCLLIVLYDRSRPASGWTGDDIGLISLGFLLENMWLMATAQGVDFSIISILGEPPAAKEITAILGIPERLSIIFGIRLGRTATKARSRSRDAPEHRGLLPWRSLRGETHPEPRRDAAEIGPHLPDVPGSNRGLEDQKCQFAGQTLR